ncbi:MAG: thiamine-phosphate pyrophosphorylase [Pyrinomonadaceae bacterium]|jgi:thiamine-phosphate pyrophosphorylase|nr:thiamine-phosphate pyrophosphorylase [Pyrinomonadaceae bacterium]
MRSAFLNALAGTQIYPLTDRQLSGMSHADQVSHLGDRGAKLVQLREKVLSPLEFYQEAEAALRVARARGIKILINDRVDIALALRADGVHLGQDDLPPDAVRRILGPNAIIGFSTHTPEQALLATTLPVDYIAIGPIFATTTKQSDNSPLGIKGVRLTRQAVKSIPLVAIGGMTLDGAAEILAAGADAVSIIRDLFVSTTQFAQISQR